jgi:hypothetical protein
MMDELISPLEQLELTVNIWFLTDVSRDEANNLLHNKEQGNFLIRNSSQHEEEDHQKLALSVKLGLEYGSIVEHFIILRSGNRLMLEDSHLKFENITSLVFHYSSVCDELPEKLQLPEVLRSTTSCHALASFSLLKKDFWNYPMSKPGRRSVIMCENQTNGLGNVMMTQVYGSSGNDFRKIEESSENPKVVSKKKNK